MATTIQAPQPQRPKPNFLFGMPKPTPSDATSSQEEWWEGGSVSSDDTTEYQLNLGAETPTSDTSSIPLESWTPASPSTSASYASSSAPRKREWTIIAGNGSSQKTNIDEWRTKRETLQKEREKAGGKRVGKDRDCGICFEYAVEPCRTLCCGKIFCREHIADWLEGPSSNGLCPACELPCSFEAGTVPLNSSSNSSSASTIRSRSGTVTKETYARGRDRAETITAASIYSPLSPKSLKSISTANVDSMKTPTQKPSSPSPNPSLSSTSSSATTSPATTVASTASTIEQWEKIQDADVGVSFSPLKAIGKIKIPSVGLLTARQAGQGEGEQQEGRQEGEETLEVLSRMASIVGFALVLYALFA